MGDIKGGLLVAVGDVVPAALPQLSHGDCNPTRRHACQHIDKVAVLLPRYLLKRLQDTGCPGKEVKFEWPALSGTHAWSAMTYTFSAH